MPRPRKGITSANFSKVDRYFALALKDNRLFPASVTHLKQTQEARLAFFALPALDWKTENLKKSTGQKRLEALQLWVDRYVTPAKWQRCLMTLRQNKSRKKLKLRRLDLPMEVYLLLKALAEKEALSLSETLLKFLKPAFKKHYAREFKKEFVSCGYKKLEG